MNRDSGTDSANGGWLRRLVRQHGHQLLKIKYKTTIPINHHTQVGISSFLGGELVCGLRFAGAAGLETGGFGAGFGTNGGVGGWSLCEAGDTIAS
jgi:hypothetical protein